MSKPKHTQAAQPARHHINIPGQLLKLIPRSNMRYRAVRSLPLPEGSDIVRDQFIKLSGAKWKHLAGWSVRRVEAWVQVDGRDTLMVFITANTTWSPRSVCDLYRARRDIEVFSKQVKQVLKFGDFPGHNANAIRRQVWTALLVHVLLRFAAHISQWGHSFMRLFAVVRAEIWDSSSLPPVKSAKQSKNSTRPAAAQTTLLRACPAKDGDIIFLRGRGGSG